MHSLPFASKRLPSEIVEVNFSRIEYKKYRDLGFTDLTRLRLDLYSRSIIAWTTNNCHSRLESFNFLVKVSQGWV